MAHLPVNIHTCQTPHTLSASGVFFKLKQMCTKLAGKSSWKLLKMTVMCRARLMNSSRTICVPSEFRSLCTSCQLLKTWFFYNCTFKIKVFKCQTVWSLCRSTLSGWMEIHLLTLWKVYVSLNESKEWEMCEQVLEPRVSHPWGNKEIHSLV